MDKCKCGCGKFVMPGKIWIVGHNMKSHCCPNNGKKQTDEHVQKRKRFGRKFSGEERRKMSEKARARSPELVKKFVEQMACVNRGKKRPEHSKLLTGKKRPEHSLAMSGPNHPLWKGGISAEPYCDVWLDEEYKESIRERDNHECQNPDCSGVIYNEKLSVHHIDYNKKHCHPDNLITLCRGCNSIANWNRQYWQGFYQTLMLSP